MLTVRRAIIPVMIALLCAWAIACGGDDNAATPTATPPVATVTPSPSPTPTAPPPTPTPLPDIDTPPDRDIVNLAQRFQGVPEDAPLVARTEPFNHEVGDEATFILFDLSIPATYEITASVRAVSEHAYFFVQNGHGNGSLARIAEDFETVVWPAVTAAFGEPASPGVDGDPRITILHADLRGAGGYVSGSDAFPRAVAAMSNEREMLYIDAENLTAPGAGYNGLVAHELQHLIHERYDAGEESWVNEGLSQVAGQLAGDSGNFVAAFLANPDLQLNDWPPGGNQVPHYAAAELFFSYLLDHYGGRENAGALLAEKTDGVEGVAAYLEAYGVTFADVFGDWTVANRLDEESGPYAHPSLSASTSVSVSAADAGDGVVHQLGTDYLRIPAGSGDTWRFQGDTEVSAGVPELDGAFWWSNRGDAIDSRLTRTLDLSETASATLAFDTWYDIEEDWDYAYVAASTDGGETWEALPGRHTTSTDPTGQSYGPGFTGESGGWVEESVDLTQFAGGEVMIRFEYVTDGASNAVGFAVDNIAVAEIGFADNGDGAGWAREGFLSVDGPLAQEWLLRVIADDGVREVTIDGDGRGGVDLGNDDVVIAVAAMTPGTTAPAAYSWSFSP